MDRQVTDATLDKLLPRSVLSRIEPYDSLFVNLISIITVKVCFLTCMQLTFRMKQFYYRMLGKVRLAHLRFKVPFPAICAASFGCHLFVTAGSDVEAILMFVQHLRMVYYTEPLWQILVFGDLVQINFRYYVVYIELIAANVAHRDFHVRVRPQHTKFRHQSLSQRETAPFCSATQKPTSMISGPMRRSVCHKCPKEAPADDILCQSNFLCASNSLGDYRWRPQR